MSDAIVDFIGDPINRYKFVIWLVALQAIVAGITVIVSYYAIKDIRSKRRGKK